MGAFLLILAIAYIVYRLMTRDSEGGPIEPLSWQDEPSVGGGHSSSSDDPVV